MACYIRKVVTNDIHLERGIKEIKDNVTEETDKTLRYLGYDYDTMDINTIVNDHDLKEAANKALRKYIDEYVDGRFPILLERSRAICRREWKWK